MAGSGAIVFEKFKHVSSIHVPPLVFNLVPERVNPSYVADEVDEWCIKFLGLKSSDVQGKRELVGSKLGLASALCYPTLPPNRLTLIAQWVAWLFLADDVLDDPQICPSDMKNITVAYAKIFNGEYAEAKSLIQSKEILRQMDMFHDLWEKLASNMNKPSKDRFVTAMDATLETFRVESLWLHHKVLPNLETYLWMRRRTSAVIPCLIAVYALQSFNLEDTVDEPLIEELERIANDHISLSNDIVSFPREWVCGKYLNIVPILSFHHNCSLDEGVMKAVKMVEDLEAEYTQVIAEINTNVELINKKGVKEYVEGIGAWMKGNSEWGWMTERYNLQNTLNRSSGCAMPLIKE